MILPMPRWAQLMIKEDLHKRIPKKVGLPVYDIKNGTLHGEALRGTVFGVRSTAGVDGVGVIYGNNSVSGSLACYWMPDITTAEGWAYVQEWFQREDESQ